MNTPTKIGRYEILEELGRGAMGVVYRAKDPAMDRIVAVKTIVSVILEGEQGKEFRERFYREAKAAGALAHPGIVSMYDVGEHDGSPFMVMEFIAGSTLGDLLKSGQRLPLDRACAIAQKVAEALGYAHRRGIVHRDIKPDNIMLTTLETHDAELPKITDFGVAKLLALRTTMTGQILGTPAFMPPEQFTGAPIDGRADLFSLGVILYWLATGDQPFAGDSFTAVSYKVVHVDPPSPRRLNPSVAVPLESIILKCLAKSPDQRYQTGEELAKDLEEFRTKGVVTAPRTTGKPAAVAVAAAAPAAPPVSTTAATAAPPTAASGPTLKRGAPKQSQPKASFVLISALAGALVAVGGWYALRSKPSPPPVQQVAVAPPPSAPTLAPPSTLPEQPSAPPQSAQTAPVPPPPAASAAAKAPVKPKTVAPSQQKQPAAPQLSATPPAAPRQAAAVRNPAAPQSAPPVQQPSTVDFDPKALNPKENAKLQIDADQMPASLGFMLEMNGKVYLQASPGNKKQFEDMYVPPGVQEFRVTASSGTVQKQSNTVSADFKAKKKSTLKIELRTQGMAAGSGVPQGLYENSQLVLTLK